MTIKLLPHNQKMVEEIETAIDSGVRNIFYSEATALGKSFIFIYLVLKYFKDKKILYICPRYSIWNNLQMIDEFKLIEDNVTMMCNANFNKLKSEHFGYDVIFIDEAHHLHTDVQGSNIINVVNYTLNHNPNAYVFGCTATPNVGKEMIGDKYFDASVMGMNHCEAEDKGVLRKINYCIAINKDLNLTDSEKKLIRTKFNVDSTHITVRSIIDRYSSINHWLAYFSNINELNENIEYFRIHFPEFKLFIIHSKIKNNKYELIEFERYSGKAILLSVSMVLEGIHPKSVEGILLYRNVQRENTLIQIIGRVSTMNKNFNPIVVDIYSSCKNLKNSAIVKTLKNRKSNNIRNHFSKEILIAHSDTYPYIHHIYYISSHQ